MGSSRQLDTRRDRLGFSPPMGSSPFAWRQAGWTIFGKAETRFEELERLRVGFPDFGRTDERKRRQALRRA